MFPAGWSKLSVGTKVDNQETLLYYQLIGKTNGKIIILW